MTPEKTNPVRRSRSSFLSALTILIAFCALGIAGLLWQKSLDHTKILQQQHAQLSQLESQLNALEDSISKPDQAWLHQQLRDAIQMAKAKLQGEKNLPQALALLQFSQAIASELHPNPLHQDLPIVIKKLQSIHQPNIRNILSSIDQARRLVQSLSYPRPSMPRSSLTSPGASGGKSEVNAWHQPLWNRLKAAVIIRKHQAPLRPLLPIAQQNILRENLLLELGSAQWALLRQDQTLYHESLMRFQKALELYVPKSPNKQHLSEAIHNLDKAYFEPQLPDLAPLLAHLTPKKTIKQKGHVKKAHQKGSVL